MGSVSMRQLGVLLLAVLCIAQVQASYSIFPAWWRLRQRVYKTFSADPQPQAAPSALLSTYPSLKTGQALHSLQPAVHGFVRKAGIVERLHWSQETRYAVAREAIFNDWRAQERASPKPSLQPGQPLTCAAARHTPTPYHHCHVFVNHKYKIAYIRSPKSSSTSIINWLGQCRYNKTSNWNATTCMEYTWEKFHSVEEIRDLWKDYFVFGFVRNPWNRAYSLYKDMVGTNHFFHKHGPLCQMEWGDFCKDPFGEFDKMHAQGCGHVEPHYAYWHMMDQYHCMVTSTGDWAVDFLGRVEHGDEDWQVVVDEMNKRRLPGVPEIQFSSYGHVHAVQVGPTTQRKVHKRPLPSRLANRRSLKYLPWGDNGDCSEADEPYCGANAHCIDAVSQWYACDAEKFAYMPAAAAAAAAVVTNVTAAAAALAAAPAAVGSNVTNQQQM